jgi:hypothetical protein
MAHLKEIVHQYNPGDIVYVVNDYKVNKVVVEAINIKITAEGRVISYSIYDYRQKNNPQRKVVSISEASLVDNITIAKASAKINWKNIIKQVTEQLDNMTDQVFEPVEEKKEE